jgi:hypothetical protein
LKFAYTVCVENRISQLPFPTTNTTSANPLPPVKNVEVRGLSDLPAIVFLTEKEGAVYFRQVGGRIDYAGFFGKHPTFLSWVKDLFQYY